MFTTLRRYQMKLNPSKCTFGVALGTFLGFMVSQSGIKANPEKMRAILEIASPKTMKEVQKLTKKDSSAQQVRLESNEQMSTLLRDTKVGLCLDGRVQESLLRA